MGFLSTFQIGEKYLMLSDASNNIRKYFIIDYGLIFGASSKMSIIAVAQKTLSRWAWSI